MLRRPWRTVALLSTFTGSSAYLYYRYTRPARPETFDLTVRSKPGPDGRRTSTMRKVPLLSMSEVNMRIMRLATLQSHPRPGGIVWKHATAQLASNDPIEDAHAALVTERDPASGAYASDGDYLFFAVMDGHSGVHTSRILSKTLIPAVALQLHQLSTSPNSLSQQETNKSYLSFFNSIKSLIGFTPPEHSASLGKPSDADPAYVSLAIQNAFAMVDAEIVGAPLRIIAEHLVQSKSKMTDTPLDLSQHPMALPSMLPALSGSCALFALLDTANRDLYIACTGDCRAVAGVWEDAPDGTGTWRVEVLSEDQTGRNPNELKRLARVFLDGNHQKIRYPAPDFKTPPYVTAQPVITHRKLDFLPLSQSSEPSPLSNASPLSSSPSLSVLPTPPEAQSAPRPTLRFVILATDGLWDELSSQDAVALVGAHLSGLRAPVISRATLAARAPTRLGTAGVEGKNKSSKKNSEDGHPWAFVDANPSAHLIRNAFGGGDTRRLRQLLSIPAPHSRRYRDDVTVTVVWWEDGRAAESRQETLKLGVVDVTGGVVKAKAKL
ncbi:hypothetical protein EW145_g327 [Phellinidium pouzarii]|uniref:PPM-type phosphatase domain-containing protein n=1 Tax=Phellinidium pouzarii TaxID=167371 RepID=A0A4S4LIW6_9AGAM|nr:hypothetical protein EW145_g327 [Phellinidium pouzarii]